MAKQTKSQPALAEELAAAQERELRALADYKNLQRRSQEERVQLLKFANQELIESLLQPLEHLSLAAEQLNDTGLNMVVTDLWNALREAGLEEIYPEGEGFNLNTMEVVEQQGDGDLVIKVVRRGYKLHGKVIKHAKVIVGGDN